MKQGSRSPKRLSLAVVCATAAVMLGMIMGGAMPAAATPGDHPYIVMGDSISYGMSASTQANSFARLLYADFQASRGADALVNRAVPGATAGSGRGSQLTSVLADINAPTDTVAFTVGFGGNEALSGSCNDHWGDSSCPLRENLNFILTEVKNALNGDPGEEFFAVLAYYNPKPGTPQEGFYDEVILGANGAIGCSDTGTNVGLNDVIFQVAGDHELPVADTYPPMKAAGPSAIAGDGIHPNDAGHAVIAQAFRDSAKLCPPTPEDGTGPVPDASVKCQGVDATIVAQPGKLTTGTGGHDIIVGTSSRDRIRAGGGNDLVCARSGNDDTTGGNGRDTLVGGAGKDRLAGQASRDSLLGQAGADSLFGGGGPDRLVGGAGPDRLFGGPAHDRLSGGPGRNRLVQ